MTVFSRFLVMALAVMAGWGAMAAERAEFNVATYNIRQYNESDIARGDGWNTRYPAVAALIDYHDFDIFGTQEGFRNQLDDLAASLPGYAYVGAGRDDGRQAGEHSAIFYRTDVFTLLENGDFWLSETPESPGLGWDAACPRICSWGRFRHNATGKEFLFFNLHMDHVGVVARRESARLICRRIAAMAGDSPVFVTGDFNVDQNSESYAEIQKDGTLRDSRLMAAKVYALNGTFNDFDANAFSDSRIDHIFVSPSVEVAKYGVLTDTYRTAEPEGSERLEAPNAPKEISVMKYKARTPSDHYPVKISVLIH